MLPFVLSVDMIFRQPDHFSVWRRSHLHNLSPANIASHCSCKNHEIATATTATTMPYMQWILAQNALLQLPNLPKLPPFPQQQPLICKNFDTELPYAICADYADLSVRHGRLGRHFDTDDIDDMDDISDNSQILIESPILILRGHLKISWSGV